MYTYPTFGKSGYCAICSSNGFVSYTFVSSGCKFLASSPKYLAALNPMKRTAFSCSCCLIPSAGSAMITKLFNFEKGVYSAPGPVISTIPSWNPTIFPVVTTAIPFKAIVFPSPTVSTFDKTPGKIPPLPSTFTRGSITSFTGVIRTLSPGFAMSNSTDTIASSSHIAFLNSSLLTYNTLFSILDSEAN